MGAAIDVAASFVGRQECRPSGGTTSVVLRLTSRRPWWDDKSVVPPEEPLQWFHSGRLPALRGMSKIHPSD
jgi:hypothetical protein